MKPLSELDHYETLEISRGASREEIERAYHLARATYADDSLAGHSVFGDGDVSVMRERIEIAYRTLAEAGSREAYDAELALEGEECGPRSPSGSDPGALAASIPPPSPPFEPVEVLELEELEQIDEDEPDASYDGARLRRTRLRRGIELDEIARVTKVNPTYLDFIEQERFEDLPAAVYVRGFVMGYAQCVGLDPERVAKSYMQRYEAKRGSPKRRMFARGERPRRGLFSRR